MKADQPRQAQMLGDKYVFDEWDCPDTIQAAFRYAGFDVVYEGMMASSIDDGGLEFRGTDATLKINRGGFNIAKTYPRTRILSSANAVTATVRSITWKISLIASRAAKNQMLPSKPGLRPRAPDISVTWPTSTAVRLRGPQKPNYQIIGTYKQHFVQRKGERTNPSCINRKLTQLP
jgi:hypothetical protein